MSRPGIVRAALAICALAGLLLAACGGDADSVRTPTPAATPAATDAAPSTGSDEPASRDALDLARRFLGYNGDGRIVPRSPVPGGAEEFDVLALPVNEDQPPGYRTLTATLRAVTEHAYVYVEQGLDVSDADVAAIQDALEIQVWPVITGAFGTPPTPGVDGDPRIAILHANLGFAFGGYVSEQDTFASAIAPHSNEREIVYMNDQLGDPGSLGYTYVLAHELQHLIQFRYDRDEAAWVNEGLSEYALSLVSGSAGSFGTFLGEPDTQLNTWAGFGNAAAHYEASGLFITYLLEQTGGDVLELAARPESGVAGVDAYLTAVGEARTFAEIVADWAVANVVDAPSGPYGYGGTEIGAPATEPASASSDGTVPQFGADNVEIGAAVFPGATELVFQGDAEVAYLAAQNDATGAVWWSGRGDNIDSTLTRELDLTAVDSATLTFRTWYEIEKSFDFAYVAASGDGGATWTALGGSSSTIDDPLGVGYGPSFGGVSGGGDAPVWIDERFDLSAYVGGRVLLRFEYVTDGGFNQPGWAIDDIAVPEIGFFDDTERDAGGWRREGFRRLEDELEQRFELRLIELRSPPVVRDVELDGRNRAVVSLDGIGTAYQTALLVVVGATEGTTEPAGYAYEIGGTR